MNKRTLILLFGLLAIALPGLLAATENLALHCPYTCSDPNTRGWDTGLTDGVWGEDHPTCFATNDSPTFPKTVTVDLGAVRSFTKVVFGVPPFGSTKTVEVSVSADNATFKPFGTCVFGQDEAQRAVLKSPKVDARYVRLTYLDAYPREVKYPVNHMFTSELEVYAEAAPAASAAVTATATPAAPATTPAAAAATPAAVAPNTNAATENLALHRPFTSSDPNTHNWDSGLTDGVWGEDRPTCFATNDSATFPKSVTVDLQATRAFSTVVVGVPPFGSTKTVEISTSADNATFKPFGKYVFEQDKAQRAVVAGAKTAARYVRLTYVDYYSRAVKYPPTFMFTSELEVYAGAAPAASAPQVNAPAATVSDPTLPKVKDEGRHREFLSRIGEGPINLLFLGDSITDFWPRRGELSWLKFAPYQPADFGISGDRTEHVLWRITNGELDGIQPKVVVVMIGTNNAGANEPEATAAGVKKIVETVQSKLPKSKILLLGIFPRDSRDSAYRKRNAAVNAIISKLDDGKTVSFLDIGPSFLNEQGEIPADVMGDRLHPSAKGYEIWYQAMLPKLKELMQ